MITGICYAIRHKKTHEIISEGIINDIYDNIQFSPSTNTTEYNVDEIPFECEARHFNTENFYLETFEFEVSRDILEKLKK